MKLKNKIGAGGTWIVVVAAISWLTCQKTEKATTYNTTRLTTGTKADQIVYRQEVKPAAAPMAKPLVKYARIVPSIPEKPHKPLLAAVAERDNKLFSTGYLKTQEFTIDGRRDTQLLAADGMKVTIPAEAFSYKDGKAVQGKITIEMKEAFSPESIVMANLVTMKGKELLESGGMYYLNAKAGSHELEVAEGKELTVEVPTVTKEKGMELFEGKQTRAGLDWANPLPLNKEEKKLKESWEEAKATLNITNKTVVVKNDVLNQDKRGVIAKGTMIKDSLGWRKLENAVQVDEAGRIIGNWNDGQQDAKLSYLMNTRRLGWANIDRLYSDPRSRRISFVTEVQNNGDFENVYITMMFKSKRIYLPGYKKSDGTYSFTHGDYEEPVLPVGEQAVIMVSAYKEGQQYFSLETITIADGLTIKMNPKTMAAADIEKEINNSL